MTAPFWIYVVTIGMVGFSWLFIGLMMWADNDRFRCIVGLHDRQLEMRDHGLQYECVHCHSPKELPEMRAEDADSIA